VTLTIAQTGELPGAKQRTGIQRFVGNNAFWLFLIDAALVVLFTAVSINHTFISAGNIKNLMLDSGEGLLLGVAIAFLLGAGEFDISLGANLIFSSVVSGMLAQKVAGAGIGVVFAVGIAAAIASGMVVGAVNAFIVTRLKVNSLIATLAMLGVVSGVAYIVSGGTDIVGLPAVLQNNFGVAALLGIPAPFLLAFLAWVIAAIVLRRTAFGLHLLAMGSSRAAAERAGLDTRRKLLLLFIAAGALAGMAGFIDITRFGATNIAGHTEDSLSAITAAVIGGTMLEGGVVSMTGLLGGVVLAVILANGLVVINVSAYYQLIVVGVILIAAVWLDQLRRSGGGSRFRAR
jgi:ribose transport system permease protein